MQNYEIHKLNIKSESHACVCDLDSKSVNARSIRSQLYICIQYFTLAPAYEFRLSVFLT